VSVLQGYLRPTKFEEDDAICFRFTQGVSVFDATVPGGLQINKNEPLLWWMNKYEEYHGKPTEIPLRTEVVWREDTLQVGEVAIRCHRTLRVPDSGKASYLPPVRPLPTADENLSLSVFH
jgi:hypothetical protein